MKVVKIEVHPIRDDEQVSGSIIIQRKRGDSWMQVRAISVISDTPTAMQNVPLQDDERVIVELSTTAKRVYDPVQKAVVAAPAPPSRPAGPEEDDYSSEVPLDEQSLRGDNLKQHLDQMQRDRLLTEARAKLKAIQTQPPTKEESKNEESKVEKESEVVAPPSWPPPGVGKK